MKKGISRSSIHKISGFTLLEILIALGLMSLVFSFALNYNFSERQLLESESKKVERAVRYCSDEASLRNKIIRMKFSLESSPQKFSIQFGPDDNFVLPAKKYPEKENLTETQIAEIEEDLKNLDRKFIPITDIDEQNLEFDESIRVLGIGVIEDKKIIYDFYPSIHFYPSGEKDGVIIFLSSDSEVLAVVIRPFSNEIETIYREIVYNEGDEIEEAQYATMISIFEEYYK